MTRSFQWCWCVRCIHVGHGVIYDLVRVLAFQPVAGQKEIGIERGTGLHVLLHFGLKGFLLAVFDYDGANLAATFHYPENGSLVFPAGAGDPATTLRDVHVPGLATDESLIRLYVAASLLN